MEGDPTQQRTAEPDELDIRFLPSDPELIIPQIQRLSIQNRTIGFETLVNITGGPMSPDIQKLLDQGLFPIVISSMNETNLKIIGLICTATRHLSAVAPQHFLELINTIPIKFLLSIPNVPEVIDFLQESAYNFEEFGNLLLSEENAQIFLNSIGTWLSQEDTAKSALELLITLSQLPNTNGFDFSIVKPFVDGQYSPDIRALALNLLTQVEPQNAEHYIQTLFSMFMNEKPTPNVFQIIHDYLQLFPNFFVNLIPQIYQRSMENIDVPDSAILLADISSHLDQPSREQIIALIFQQPNLCIERADAIYRMCSGNNNNYKITLPPNFIEQLVSNMEACDSEEVLQCTEAILKLHANYFASPELQAKILPVFEREPQFSVYGFKTILFCCNNCEVAAPVLQAFYNFAHQFESNFDEEIHSDVLKFLQSHKL
ncbi:hypothetical protein M9Y10_001384 [Tritrichomonas musculus]|uniref:Uncharacterized protein n=1 Tax=Tritrichomonas musculus TaxID=1915356 RepID=A0ABR2L6V2_9EUKA